MPETTAAPTFQVDDPALDGADWLFQRDGKVYGPVEGRRLAELLYRGELVGATLVSSGDGSWQPVAHVPQFLLHVKKAEAALRVEQEVTGARALRVRQARTRTAGLLIGALALVGGAGGLALWLGRSGDHSPLLDDFGAGISISVPARVGVAGRGGAGEVEVAVTPDAQAQRPANGSRPARPASSPSAAQPGGGELVATQFDAARIQEVVNRQQRTLAPCLRAEAERAPDFAGEVPLEFTIGNEGKVVRVVIADPRMRQGALRDCFERVLQGWTFDTFPGQRPSVALVFKVGK
jgi:GYF domain 2